jgi:hypothetical protein
VSQPIITVTATIMDGTVIRWYASVQAADGGRATVSASRNCVMVHDLAEHAEAVPAEWLAAAEAAHAVLRQDRNADVKHLATHHWPLFGVLAPVEP